MAGAEPSSFCKAYITPARESRDSGIRVGAVCELSEGKHVALKVFYLFFSFCSLFYLLKHMLNRGLAKAIIR